jgi:hydrogenase maturation protein HypF
METSYGAMPVGYCALRVLGGGCFLNIVLSQALTEGLSAHGLRALTAQQLPPNDGGISLGQASIALQSINKGA